MFLHVDESCFCATGTDMAPRSITLYPIAIMMPTATLASPAIPTTNQFESRCCKVVYISR